MANFFTGFAEGLGSGMQSARQREANKIKQQEVNLKAKQVELEANSDRRMQEKWNIEKSAYIEQQKQSMELKAAAQEGGYEGAVAYLDKTNPKLAIEYRTAKAELDNKILDGQDASVKTEQQKQDLLKSGYIILGNTASILNKLPEEQRAEVYAAMAPSLRQVNPDMPAVYNEKARAMLLLGLGQAVPANDIYQAENQMRSAQSSLGKYMADIENLKARGYTDDSPEVKTLQTQIESVRDKAVAAKVTQVQAMMDQSRKGEDVLRKEYLKVNGDYMKVRDSYNRIEASAKDPSAAGDLAMVFNYMKMLDPASVVRESEFATAQNSAGVPDRIRAQWNRLQKGERLAPATRADFLKRSNMLMEAQSKGYNKMRAEYTRLAMDRGYDPKAVIPELSTKDKQDKIDAISKMSDQDIMNKFSKDEKMQDWVQRAQKVNPGMKPSDLIRRKLLKEAATKAPTEEESKVKEAEQQAQVEE